MSDSIPGPIALVPSQWADKPQAVIDAMLEQTDRGIIIDASKAGRISAQVAQLLLAGQAHAAARSTDFRIDSISDEARASLETLGVANLLLEQYS